VNSFQVLGTSLALLFSLSARALADTTTFHIKAADWAKTTDQDTQFQRDVEMFYATLFPDEKAVSTLARMVQDPKVGKDILKNAADNKVLGRVVVAMAYGDGMGGLIARDVLVHGSSAAYGNILGTHAVLEIRPLTADDKRLLSIGGRFRAWIHGNRQAYVIKADACTACGRCVQACPVPNVIKLRRQIST